MTLLAYTQIPNDSDNCPVYAKRYAGSLSDIAEKLYNEYLTQGYSLTPDDIGDVLLCDVGFYAGWYRLDAQMTDDKALMGQYEPLSLSTPILADEWAIIMPVVRSHIDLVQARRMEGAGSLGVTPFGLSSTEALSNYNQAIETMKREAFWHGCFSV